MSDLERLRQVHALFMAVGSLPPGQWQQSLQARCADASLVTEVLELLRRDAGDEFLALARASAQATIEDMRPKRIDGYTIVDTLGEGGMGTVYLADQDDGVKRRVALKLIKPGLGTPEVVARFQHERQVLAGLSHDGIAKVFDCGTAESGQPYFAMEYVDGVSLCEFCDRYRWSVDKRMRLFLQVCDAVIYAHRENVVHRDLTPRNVLVSRASGHVVAKIIDFGLAKAMVADADRAGLTDPGQMMGTFEYMAPEQADPRWRPVGVRADIHALGAVAHELLVGSPPWSRAEVLADGLGGAPKRMRELELPRASRRLAAAQGREAVAARRDTTAEVLVGVLRRDLDWVLAKALEREPERRYQTVAELAADVRRFLAHEPVSVGPPSLRYRLGKWLRRRRGPVTVAASALVTAAIVVPLFWRRASVADEKLLVKDAAQTCQHAKTAFEALWPAWPSQVPDLQEWLWRVGCLPGAGPAIAAELSEVTAQASGVGPTGVPQFATAELAARRVDLLRLQEDIEFLTTTAARGMERRLAWAQEITAITVAHPKARLTWDEVRADLRTRRPYAGIGIELPDEDVIGLVPLGVNPATGLHEALDLASSCLIQDPGSARAVVVPQHEQDGRVRVHGGSGIIYVLLPGGTFRIGASAADIALVGEVNAEAELPVRDVSLAPFWIARHELTRGQWRRLMGTVPFTVTRDDDRLPAETITHEQALACLARIGATLPTEAQWEFACRAGSTSLWWTGDDPNELLRAASLGPDSETAAASVPAGSKDANPFGLHEVHGNVAEWCLDRIAFRYDRPGFRAGDGLRVITDVEVARAFVVRGGDRHSDREAMRSAARACRDTADVRVGFRAARLLGQRR
ncbi:MAG: SUMF1/EgtB/PvdO family nonheme iron enzyme [Planctomycetes bacterium]|nr:SUMF1/EgtB/PvdO family nonheme iron enzyme [Planctomycetota bacterium]